MGVEYKSAPLTEGNLKNDHVYLTPFMSELPAEVIGGGNRSALAADSLTPYWGDQLVRTDVAGDRKIFRNRGFIRRFLQESGAEVGDVVVFEALGTHDFRLHLQKEGERRISGSASADTTVSKAEAMEKGHAPSNGIVPSFGTRQSLHADGSHFLYAAVFKGDAARLLGKADSLVDGKILVKVGMSNDTGRRCSELNSGFPPSARGSWKWSGSRNFPMRICLRCRNSLEA